MPNALTGLSGIAGINAIEEQTPEATPEERMGGPADPYHGHWGEQAAPYPWQSSIAMSGSHGPYGPENQLLGDEMDFMEIGGMPGQDPSFDYNVPNLTRSHASVHNITSGGPVPSQSEAINHQLSQMGNHASDMGTSRRMGYDETLFAQQDNWQEIWNVTPGSDDVTLAPMQTAIASGGWGTNDHTSNPQAKRNQFGLGSGHMHRRFATGSIPGNYMWMRPGGRMLFKTLPGPARPAIGANSPFEGDNLGSAFAYDNGAILQTVPTEYIPPPSPNVAPVTPVYDNGYGTDGVDMW